MRSIQSSSTRSLKSRTAIFLTTSFLFAMLSATLLYLLVLLLLDGYPFTGEDFKLYYTMLLTIWLFLLGLKTLLAGITLLEKIIKAEKAGRINLLLLFKKIAIPVLAIFICYASYAQHVKNNTPQNSLKIPLMPCLTLRTLISW